jgi:hypothetical protein
MAVLLLAAAPSGHPGSAAPPGGGSVPPRRDVLRFAVLGDFGWGGTAQRDVARAMCRYRRDHPFRFVVTTGDNVYPDGRRARFRTAFFGPNRCLLANGARFHATLGNHDYVTRRGRPEVREPAFGMPRRNYVWRRKGVRFVMVDSNRLRGRWLRRALVAERGDRWTIAVFHHPVLSPGPHGSTPGFRPGLPRLFRRRGVDLVLNGHDHIYFVSKARKGIRYVVTGGGGAPLYTCGRRAFTSFCRARYHFVYVAARRQRIWVRAVTAEGRPFGLFSTDGRGPAGRPRQ